MVVTGRPPFNAYDHDHPGGNSSIRARSGLRVDLLNPTPDMIRLSDIAHGLANINRFGGHTARPWSVAEHSLVVAGLLHRQFGNDRLTLAGLLHDATEAYLGDVVRPLKQALPEYQIIEQRMADVIAYKFFSRDTAVIDDPRVKAADELALVFDMATIRDATWRTPNNPDDVINAFMHQAWITGAKF